MIKIIAISDTHNQLDKVELPEGDILVHGGDLTMGGSLEEFYKLNVHLGKIKRKYKHILLNAGNHDHLAQGNPKLAKSLITNAKLLIDEEITVEGLKFYFSPWSNWFHDWSFNFSESDLDNGEIEATKKYAEIPDDVNVLITHGPAFNLLDKVNNYSVKNKGRMHVGSTALAKRINELKNLKLSVCAHIHESYGRLESDGKTFVNAAILNEYYQVTNKPWVIEL